MNTEQRSARGRLLLPTFVLVIGVALLRSLSPETPLGASGASEHRIDSGTSSFPTNAPARPPAPAVDDNAPVQDLPPTF